MGKPKAPRKNIFSKTKIGTEQDTMSQARRDEWRHTGNYLVILVYIRATQWSKLLCSNIWGGSTCSLHFHIRSMVYSIIWLLPFPRLVVCHSIHDVFDYLTTSFLQHSCVRFDQWFIRLFDYFISTAWLCANQAIMYSNVWFLHIRYVIT